MPRAAIVSLGGSPEPIVKTIEVHVPEFVCFLASQQSVDLVGEVKARLREKGIVLHDYKVIVDDANDLIHCYERALACAAEIERLEIPPEEVIVDYTGGTKSMTAALTLATVGRGFGFSYVGGRERTKEGLGIVIDGTEEIRTGLSPWQIFAVEERKRIAQYFNSYQFEAAATALRQTKKDLQEADRLLWDRVELLCLGYRSWEGFDHREATSKLSQGAKGLGDYLALRKVPNLECFYAGVTASLDFLKRLQEGTRGFQAFHLTQAIDLVANARRRGEEGKYDDGVARLYRALEMIGQLEFEAVFQCPTGEAKPDKLPESIREEYHHRYLDPRDGKVKLPLFAAFRALKEAGNPRGLSFFGRQEEILKLLSARNSSILAHGFTPISERAFRSLLGLIVEAFPEVAEEVPFPKIEW